VTRLDQESADVLVEILTAGTPTGPLAQWWRREVEDHWRYSQAATVSSGSIEMQRILLARGLLSPQGARG
jgi:hypothetical protein